MYKSAGRSPSVGDDGDAPHEVRREDDVVLDAPAFDSGLAALTVQRERMTSIACRTLPCWVGLTLASVLDTRTL